MDQETRTALRDRLDDIDANDDIGGRRPPGKGDSYIAGGDIEAFAEFDRVDALEYLTNYGQGLYNDVADLTVPTIAAIDGYAFRRLGSLARL